jgi:hypothetical protein
MRVWSGVGLGVLLVITWAIAFVVMKVASAAIHLLLLVAFALLAANLLRKRGRGVEPPA